MPPLQPPPAARTRSAGSGLGPRFPRALKRLSLPTNRCPGHAPDAPAAVDACAGATEAPAVRLPGNCSSQGRQPSSSLGKQGGRGRFPSSAPESLTPRPSGLVGGWGNKGETDAGPGELGPVRSPEGQIPLYCQNTASVHITGPLSIWMLARCTPCPCHSTQSKPSRLGIPTSSELRTSDLGSNSLSLPLGTSPALAPPPTLLPNL